jgi:hypothetical protein
MSWELRQMNSGSLSTPAGSVKMTLASLIERGNGSSPGGVDINDRKGVLAVDHGNREQ